MALILDNDRSDQELTHSIESMKRNPGDIKRNFKAIVEQEAELKKVKDLEKNLMWVLDIADKARTGGALNIDEWTGLKAFSLMDAGLDRPSNTVLMINNLLNAERIFSDETMKLLDKLGQLYETQNIIKIKLKKEGKRAEHDPSTIIPHLRGDIETLLLVLRNKELTDEASKRIAELRKKIIDSDQDPIFVKLLDEFCVVYGPHVKGVPGGPA